MRTRRITLVVTLLAALILGFAPAAQAGTFRITTRWKSCDTFKSAIAVRVTFKDPAYLYGSGKYMVKRWIEWEVYKSGMWREEDRYYSESNWVKVTNKNYDWTTTPGDRTGWGNTGLYYSHWRAKVTVKLIKNRKGPRDKKVDEVQIFPMKGSFREIGSNCGYEF
ncbi:MULTISPECIES: hypothetical protein [Aeromicrobium]|uniref:Uncharacterized protein n=1 Tax=Aeromicrobium phoceense TaxID=2754045 RepID=A0A838XLF0_9ACTN|nr:MULTISPECIES: hypothetical protein [Aeromicrobium]MBA4607700.1 hypothetical protein [Aeromicrobium phoceense]